MELLLTAYRTRPRSVQWHHRRPSTPQYRTLGVTECVMPISHRCSDTTYHLTTTTRTDLQGHLRSKIFYFIWKGVCDFLLVINSNLGLIFHRFWDGMISLEKRTFCLPSPFYPKFENVLLAVLSYILHLQSLDTKSIIRFKNFP